MVAVF